MFGNKFDSARERERCGVLCAYVFVKKSKFVNVKVLTSQHEFTHISINYQLTDGQTLAKRGYKWIIHIEKLCTKYTEHRRLTCLGGKKLRKKIVYIFCLQLISFGFCDRRTGKQIFLPKMARHIKCHFGERKGNVWVEENEKILSI